MRLGNIHGGVFQECVYPGQTRCSAVKINYAGKDEDEDGDGDEDGGWILRSAARVGRWK